MVDSNNYAKFINSLVHVFRNMIDHVIETPDERILAEKDPFGTISCEVKAIDDLMTIRIADDGCGIDIEKIKQKAIDLELYLPEELETFHDKEIYQLIFLKDFSTKVKISELSGRGIGLYAVKSTLNENTL